MAEYNKCVRCGTTEIEPYTPAAFDSMMTCRGCGHHCCERCGDTDGDIDSEGYYNCEIRCLTCPEIHHEDCECEVHCLWTEVARELSLGRELGSQVPRAEAWRRACSEIVRLRKVIEATNPKSWPED